jgi:hypothetical protein
LINTNSGGKCHKQKKEKILTLIFSTYSKVFIDIFQQPQLKAYKSELIFLSR